MSQSRRWCFTWNNYTEESTMTVTAFAQEKCRYLVFGKEVGESGTPHLQGFFVLHKQARLTALRRSGLTCHLEPTKKTSEQAAEYCKKEGDFTEFGSLPSDSGRRSDLEAFKQAVKDGTVDLKRLREDHSEVVAKYPRFVSDYIRDQLPEPEIPMHALNDWQQNLNQILIHEPDDRQVIFVVDRVGNQGKSWFAKYYCQLHDNAFLMRPGKHADMTYMLPPSLRVLFLDCTRKQVEYMPYTFMEELKDGYVSCTKYESCVKKYHKLHVVVLMNQEPDMEALSEDRYHIINLA